MLKEATLGIEYAAVNPPKPTSVCILVDSKVIAVASLDELKRAAARLAEMEAARL